MLHVGPLLFAEVITQLLCPLVGIHRSLPHLVKVGQHPLQIVIERILLIAFQRGIHPGLRIFQVALINIEGRQLLRHLPRLHLTGMVVLIHEKLLALFLPTRLHQPLRIAGNPVIIQQEGVRPVPIQHLFHQGQRLLQTTIGLINSGHLRQGHRGGQRYRNLVQADQRQLMHQFGHGHGPNGRGGRTDLPIRLLFLVQMAHFILFPGTTGTRIIAANLGLRHHPLRPGLKTQFGMGHHVQ